MLAEEEENEVQALFSATLSPPDADAATISLTWMALSPFGFVTCRNCARQTSGVSEGVADRDLVADAESEAEAVVDADTLAVAATDAPKDKDALGVTARVDERLEDALRERVAATEALTERDAATEALTLADAAGEELLLGDAATERLALPERETVTDVDGNCDTDKPGVTLLLAVTEAETVELRLREALAEALAREPLRLALALFDAVRLS